MGVAAARGVVFDIGILGDPLGLLTVGVEGLRRFLGDVQAQLSVRFGPTACRQGFFLLSRMR